MSQRMARLFVGARPEWGVAPFTPPITCHRVNSATLTRQNRVRNSVRIFGGHFFSGQVTEMESAADPGRPEPAAAAVTVPEHDRVGASAAGHHSVPGSLAARDSSSSRRILLLAVVSSLASW